MPSLGHDSPLARALRGHLRRSDARAEPPVVGAQRWRRLLFAHWRVPVERLRPLVPAALEIERFDGHGFAGLIPFRMEDVRPLAGLPPVPGAAAFFECNARTYVRHRGVPGIYFFSLDASSSLAVLGARLGLGLPYFRTRISSTERDGALCYQLERRWPRRRRAGLTLRYRPGLALGAARPGSLEHFLVERYTLYSVRRSGAVFRVDVRHHPYPLRDVTVESLDESVLAAAGLDLAGCPRTLDLYSDGVDVEIEAARRVA